MTLFLISHVWGWNAPPALDPPSDFLEIHLLAMILSRKLKKKNGRYFLKGMSTRFFASFVSQSKSERKPGFWKETKGSAETWQKDDKERMDKHIHDSICPCGLDLFSSWLDQHLSGLKKHSVTILRFPSHSFLKVSCKKPFNCLVWLEGLGSKEKCTTRFGWWDSLITTRGTFNFVKITSDLFNQGSKIFLTSLTANLWSVALSHCKGTTLFAL